MMQVQSALREEMEGNKNFQKIPTSFYKLEESKDKEISVASATTDKPHQDEQLEQLEKTVSHLNLCQGESSKG